MLVEVSMPLPMRVTRRVQGRQHEVEIVAGQRYQVVPRLKRKQKHRDRFCIAVDVVQRDRLSRGPAARIVVRFEDTGRLGRVDPDDLLPAVL